MHCISRTVAFQHHTSAPLSLFHPIAFSSPLFCPTHNEDPCLLLFLNLGLGLDSKLRQPRVVGNDHFICITQYQCFISNPQQCPSFGFLLSLFSIIIFFGFCFFLVFCHSFICMYQQQNKSNTSESRERAEIEFYGSSREQT